MKVTRAKIIGMVVAAIAVAGFFFATRPKPIVVDTAIVDHHPLETTVDADGRTRVRDRYVVVAPVAGRLERITRVEGAVVRAGDVVARLMPLPLDSEAVTQARARLDAASARALEASGQVRVARASLDQRRRELSRANRLAEVGGVAPRTVEECELAVVDAEEAARGATERASAAEAESRQARAVLAARDAGASNVVLVRAPVGGRVLRVPERSERIVAAGALLMELGNPLSLEVVIDILSSDAAMVHPGDVVRFAEWGGDDVERAPATIGRVRDVEPSGFTKTSALGVEEQRVNVIAEIEGVPATIGDGFRVEASIRVWSAPDVLVVPRSALLRPDGGDQGERGWSVFVVRAGRVETRTVRVGHVGGAAAEVLGGVSAGEEVVVFPSDRIAAGTRVAARQGG